MYSDNISKAKLMPEYSTIYPEPNSASDSATSKGIFLISVSIVIIYKKAKGSKAKNNDKLLPCLNKISRKLSDPFINIEPNNTRKVDKPKLIDSKVDLIALIKAILLFEK